MKKRFNKKSGDKVFYFSNCALSQIRRKTFVRAYKEYRKNLINLKESHNANPSLKSRSGVSGE